MQNVIVALLVCVFAVVLHVSQDVEGSEDKECPSHHPYAYLDGQYCCKYNRETISHEGSQCDGSVIAYDSKCCQSHAFVKCAGGACKNYIPKWNAPTEGWCLTCDGQDQEGKSTFMGDGLSKSNCLSKCKAEPDATGCEWDINGHCIAHNEPVSKGSETHAGYTCWTKERPCQVPCPQGYPYAYNSGHYCCAEYREKFYAPLGPKCDGSVIGYGSKCCQNDRLQKCPSEYGCTNYGGISYPVVVNGGWTSWIKGRCTHKCLGGRNTETRSCTNPSPKYGGRGCSGPRARTRQCSPYKRCRGSNIGNHRGDNPYGVRADNGAGDGGKPPIPKPGDDGGKPPIPKSADELKQLVERIIKDF